jgi:hypothetical protein
LDVDFSSIVCSVVCTSHVTASLSQHMYSWNDTFDFSWPQSYAPAFSWPQSSSAVLSSVASLPSLVWFVLRFAPHMLQHHCHRIYILEMIHLLSTDPVIFSCAKFCCIFSIIGLICSKVCTSHVTSLPHIFLKWYTCFQLT